FHFSLLTHHPFCVRDSSGILIAENNPCPNLAIIDILIYTLLLPLLQNRYKIQRIARPRPFLGAETPNSFIFLLIVYCATNFNGLSLLF
ncbi:hypothetical protein, partial [Autumnicola psychrophila]